MAALALGTVQFGLRYGVANQAGQVSESAVADILSAARAGGVKVLDTAVAYGASEAVLGKVGIASWDVISKLPPLSPAVTDGAHWVSEQIEGSLQRLGVERLEGLLLHRSGDLLGLCGEGIREGLSAARRQGLVRSIGVSIYSPTELDRFWPELVPDIVQAPFNVLDRRLATSGWLDRMAAAKVRLHTRSVFLQGLLLMPLESVPQRFDAWRPVLQKWHAWCERAEVTPLQAALKFVLAQQLVECAVVGVDSLLHLQEILAARDAHDAIAPAELACDDEELIDPSRWKAA